MRCYMGKNIAFWKLILKIPLCQWSDWGKRNYWWINAVHLHLWQVASVPSALSVISLRVWRGGGRWPAWWWYDGAVSQAGLVPCLHCVLLLSTVMSTSTHCHPEPRAAIPTRQPPSISARLSSAAGETQVDRKVGPRLSSSRPLTDIWGLAPSWHWHSCIVPAASACSRRLSEKRKLWVHL